MSGSLKNVPGGGGSGGADVGGGGSCGGGGGGVGGVGRSRPVSGFSLDQAE